MRIVKLGYSSRPWRIVNKAGMEVETVCAATGICGPICADTKKELLDWLLDRFEWYATHAINGLLPPVYSQNWRKGFENAPKD